MKKLGFTLIELVVVIALIAILAVTLAPRLRDQMAKAKDTEAISALGALRTLSETYYTDEQVAPYGGIPSGENDFSEVQSGDISGLDLLIPNLNIQGMKVFGGGSNWEPGDGYTAPIGGSRETIDGEVKYSGEIGYTFHAPADTSADGISLWFTKYTLSPDGLGFDTKGHEWIEY